LGKNESVENRQTPEAWNNMPNFPPFDDDAYFKDDSITSSSPSHSLISIESCNPKPICTSRSSRRRIRLEMTRENFKVSKLLPDLSRPILLLIASTQFFFYFSEFRFNL
jgi:hypothetical protein